MKGILDVAATATVLVAAVVAVVYYSRARDRSEFVATGGIETISTTAIGIESAPILGNASAPVAVIIFSEFECPYCQSFSNNVLPALKSDYVATGKVLLAFKHFPLDSIHADARFAAELAACAADRGRFWQTHDYLFEPSTDLASLTAEKLSPLVDVDLTAPARCPTVKDKNTVASDVDEGRKLGVRGTPTFFAGRLAGKSVSATRRVSGTQCIGSPWAGRSLHT